MNTKGVAMEAESSVLSTVALQMSLLTIRNTIKRSCELKKAEGEVHSITCHEGTDGE
jgi:hypothetical protein